jgi:hypothetical protein
VAGDGDEALMAQIAPGRGGGEVVIDSLAHGNPL